MRAAFWLIFYFLGTMAHVSLAQDIEPRAYSNAPIGINFLGAGYAEAQSSRYRTGSEIVG